VRSSKAYLLLAKALRCIARRRRWTKRFALQPGISFSEFSYLEKMVGFDVVKILSRVAGWPPDFEVHNAS
jgi:hypothetical protein